MIGSRWASLLLALTLILWTSSQSSAAFVRQSIAKRQQPFFARSLQSSSAATWSNADSAIKLDSTSVSIGSKRVFIFSAEFHPWRLPVPKLWRDVLYKLKEGGFNTISIYTHWGLISPSIDSVDTSGINDLALFLDVAKEVGLFVNVRLGPYINAETTGGGLPGWVESLPAALRTNDTAYYNAWKPYVQALGKVIATRQIKLNSAGDNLDTASGPVTLVQLENEWYETPKTAGQVRQLKQVLSDVGVNSVPLSYNEANALSPQPSFAKIVDFYGVDSYPQNFDCKNPTKWAPIPTGYDEALNKINITKIPHAVWELQGGSFDPYQGAGFDKCYQLTNERFARVFDQALMAQNFKTMSHYMGYGGTSWGNLAEPTVYSSYDYGAGISEDRQIRDKNREYGLLGTFLRSSPLFPAAHLVKSGVNLGVTGQSSNVLVYHRSATGDHHAASHWYIVRHNDSTSTAQTDFKLKVRVGNQDTTIPIQGNVHLDGRDSKIISTDHLLPSGAKLLYSTAPLSYSGQIGSTDVVVVYGEAGQSFETVLEGRKPQDASKAVQTGSDQVKVTKNEENGNLLRVRMNWSAAPGKASHALVKFQERDVLVVLADRQSAYLTRPLTLAPANTLSNILVEGNVALVSGGYHFSNITLDGQIAHLSGQSNETSTIEIISPSAIDSATFNGEKLQGKGKTWYGSYQFLLPGPSDAAKKYQAPELTGWKYADSLPEVAPEFDDSKWTKADKTSTSNAYFYLDGISTDGHVLFSDEYGFHGGHILWRGHFDVDNVQAVKGFKIRLQGGSFFGGSVWLNGHFLGSATGNGNRSDGHVDAKIDGTMLKKTQNVVTVLHDSTGREEWVGGKPLGSGNSGEYQELPLPKGAKYPLEGPKIPRGILSYSFDSAQHIAIKDWRVQGNLGGGQCPDKTRKCLNEGGLYAERQGWHLPGFDTSHWSTSTGGLSIPSAGVRYYTTTFRASTPSGHDIPLSLSLPSAYSTHRVQIYINGWQFGKQLVQFGPQNDFVLPVGILDPSGVNTIGVALWALDGKGTTVEGEVKLEVKGVYKGDVDYLVDNPGYKELRS
ncbi:unnamed protein product [Sympodiomycopsis kandeliae]